MSNAPPADRTAYVSQMAAQLQIDLSPEDTAKVAGFLANLARAAAQLDAAQLDDMTVGAPVFTPQGGGAP